MADNFGVGALGGVVLVDPETGLPYKATGGGGGGGGADILVLGLTEDVPIFTPALTVILRADLAVPDPGGTPPALVAESVTTAGGGGLATLALDKPAGVEDGDLLVAYLTNQQGPPPSGPIWEADGWITLHELYSPTDARSSGWYALAVPDASALAEVAGFEFTVTTSAGRSAGCLFRCTGVDLTNPVLATSDVFSTSTDAVTIPSLTLVEQGLVLAGFHLGAVTSGNAGMPGSVDDEDLVKVAEVASAEGSTGTRSSVHVYGGLKEAGSAGPFTHTWPATVGGRGGMAVALRGAS